MRWRDIFFHKQDRLRSGWRALAFLLIALPLANLLQSVYAMPLERLGLKLSAHPLLELLVFGLAYIPTLLGAATWTASTFEHLPSRTLGLSLDEFWLVRLLWGFVGGAAVLMVLLLALQTGGITTLTWTMPDSRDWAILGATAVIMLIGSAGLMLLIGGYLLQTLLRGIGLPALLLCMLLLVLPNYANMLVTHPILVITLLLNCLLLGLLYLRSGSLWLPIGVNAGWNFALLLFKLPMEGRTWIPSPFHATLAGHPLLTGGAYGPENGAFAALTQFLLLVLVAVLPFGKSLASRWWEWRELLLAPSSPRPYDFTIGARRYQWRFMLPEDSE